MTNFTHMNYEADVEKLNSMKICMKTGVIWLAMVLIMGVYSVIKYCKTVSVMITFMFHAYLELVLL